MADFIEVKRNRPDYSQIISQLGPGLNQGITAQSNIMAQLMPLVFKAKLERETQKQQMQDFADLAAKSGNGPLGAYKWSWSPSTGFSYTQKSVDEQMKDVVAQKRKDAMSGQPSQVSPIINKIVPSMTSDAVTNDLQVPQVISDVMGGGEPPQWIANPNFAMGGDEFIANPARKVWETIQEEKRKGMPAESGGKTAALQQAVSDIRGARDLLFPKTSKYPEGEFSHARAWASNLPMSKLPLIGRIIPDAMPGITSAKLINSRMTNAIEAKLRIETGATAPQPELDRIAARFAVTVDDTAISAKDKLNRLEDFVKNAVIKIDPTGKYTYSEINDPDIKKYLNTATNLVDYKSKYGLQ